MSEEILLRIADVERGAICLMCFSFAIHFLRRDDDAKLPRRDATLRLLISSLMGWLGIGCIYGCVAWTPAFEILWVKKLLFLLDLITLPLIFLLLTNITRRKPITTWRVLKYVVPMVCLLPAAFFSIPHEELIFLGAAGIYVCLMAFHTVRAILRFEHYMRDQYSDSYGRGLKWLVGCILLLVIVLFSWLGFFVCDGPLFRVFFYLAHIIIWPLFCLNISKIIQTRESARTDTESLDDEQIIDNADADTTADETSMMRAEAADGMPTQASLTPEEVFEKRLQAVCEQTRLFTTEDLTREELARAMMMNHTYLTKMLKRTKGKSFYEYINGLRMQYAGELLSDPQFPLDAIPLEVGYKHRSTYYRVFSDTYGCTPLEYRNRKMALTPPGQPMPPA